MLEWFQPHRTVIVWLASGSVVMFVAALVAAPWIILRLPQDYFAAHKRPKEPDLYGSSSIGRVALLVLKNALGGVLVLAGVVMLVAPGQGVLTIIVGLVLMNFPGKFRLERWLVSRGPVLKAINSLRRRWDRPPLVLDDDS